ncbi:sulfotransferase domain-containing protein [Candidatus Uabimicrobium sp. HlEnr_7]|uniref:sulfotransferase domain-containing protein n=1 Tax=Candidatus Uabimicrobium helgolandensis TaxID=3095367 RepID=UPI003555D193
MESFNYSIVNYQSNEWIMPPYFTQEVLENLYKKFTIRNEDTFIVSYPKSGTHWVKQILYILVHGKSSQKEIIENSIPFLDVEAANVGLFGLEHLEKISSRRYFHSHLPLALMPSILNGKAKYIYIARNPKDCAVSYYHFARQYQRMNFQGTWDEFFTLYMNGKIQYGSIFDHVVTWWKRSQTGNDILFIKYEDMHKNLSTVVEKIANFLNVPLTPNLLKTICTQSQFHNMKENDKVNGQWITGLENTSLLRKGKIGDWQNHFNEEQNKIFDSIYQQKMVSQSLTFDFN